MKTKITLNSYVPRKRCFSPKSKIDPVEASIDNNSARKQSRSNFLYSSKVGYKDMPSSREHTTKEPTLFKRPKGNSLTQSMKSLGGKLQSLRLLIKQETHELTQPKNLGLSHHFPKANQYLGNSCSLKSLPTNLMAEVQKIRKQSQANMLSKQNEADKQIQSQRQKQPNFRSVKSKISVYSPNSGHVKNPNRNSPEPSIGGNSNQKGKNNEEAWNNLKSKIIIHGSFNNKNLFSQTETPPKSDPHTIHDDLDIVAGTQHKVCMAPFTQKEKWHNAPENTLSSTINVFIHPEHAQEQIKQNYSEPISPRSYLHNTSGSLLNPISKVTLADFKVYKLVGRGKFGQVYMAKHRQTNFIVALKKINKVKVRQYKMGNQIVDQIKLHSSLNHPNIVKFYGFFEEKQSVYFILEYVTGGTLFEHLNSRNKIPLTQTSRYMRDIITAVQYLHQKSIAHRDIKPENILLSSQGVTKLCDFGWSALVQTSRRTYCGTFDYVPPEILQRKDYDLSVDIWCLGILTYELLLGKVPYEGDRRTIILNKINDIQIKFPRECKQFPKCAKQFINALIRKNPAQRPKCKDLVAFQFLNLR